MNAARRYVAVSDRRYEFSPDEGKHWWSIRPGALFDLLRPRYSEPEKVLKQIDDGETIIISPRSRVRAAGARGVAA